MGEIDRWNMVISSDGGGVYQYISKEKSIDGQFVSYEDVEKLINTPKHETVEGWISVDVRLPEIGEEILCFSSTGSTTNIFSDEIKGYEDFDYGRRCLVTGYHEYILSSDVEFFWGEVITHWQPLPKAPEVG